MHVLYFTPSMELIYQWLVKCKTQIGIQLQPFFVGEIQMKPSSGDMGRTAKKNSFRSKDDYLPDNENYDSKSKEVALQLEKDQSNINSQLHPKLNEVNGSNKKLEKNIAMVAMLLSGKKHCFCCWSKNLNEECCLACLQKS